MNPSINKSFSKTLSIYVLIFILIIACKKSNSYNTEIKTEAEASYTIAKTIDSIEQLEQVKQLRKTSNQLNKIVIRVEDGKGKCEDCLLLQYGINNNLRYIPSLNFYTDTTTYQVFFYEPLSDRLQLIRQFNGESL